MSEVKTDQKKSEFSVKKLIPIILIVAGAVAGYLLLKDYLTFDTLRDNREALINWRDSNYFLAAVLYILLYIVAVAFSLPGGALFSITGGFLFGLVNGTSFTVVGATIGAVLIFLAAKYGLGDYLRSKAGGWMRKVEDGVGENEISYMLILRLIPVMPFFVANLIPAFIGIRLSTYIWTTFIGIIPGSLVYTSIGSGLGEVFARGDTPDLSLIWEWHIIGPILGLIALAMLPIIIKKFRKNKEA